MCILCAHMIHIDENIYGYACVCCKKKYVHLQPCRNNLRGPPYISNLKLADRAFSIDSSRKMLTISGNPLRQSRAPQQHHFEGYNIFQGGIVGLPIVATGFQQDIYIYTYLRMYICIYIYMPTRLYLHAH